MTTYQVLIVDDSPAQREDVADTLRFSSTLTYEPLEASSSSEALAQYQAYPDISLIILDTDLNPTNEKGWQVYDKLREAGYTGPALARSGRDQDTEWEVRNIPFLGKDAEPSVLETKVYELITEISRT